MSIRQFRPKRNMRRGISTQQRFWINSFFIILLGFQMAYPLVDGRLLTQVTIVTVIVGACYVYIDALINFGGRYANLLALITLIFSFGIEAIGQATSWPFGSYEYSKTLGFSILSVPIVVPLAWLMMSYPVFLVSRKSTNHWVFLFGGYGLMTWDLFLDPQMVSAERWVWTFDGAHVPFQNEIPLSNAVGWLLSGMALMALLNVALPKERRKKHDRTKHVEIFLLWTLFSGVIGNIFFFNKPGVALIGGLAFTIFLAPYFYKLFIGNPESN